MNTLTLEQDALKLKQYEKLGPFEIKDFLAKVATKSAEEASLTYLNAGRGNPNWVATEPREAFFLLGQFAVTEALKLGDMTALMPFDFLKLVWATFLGIIFFAEVPDFLTWVGAAVVFGSSLYIAWREATLRRRAEAE